MYIVTQEGTIVTNLQAVRAYEEGARGVIKIEHPDYGEYSIAKYENIDIAKAVVEELIFTIESGRTIYRMPPRDYGTPKIEDEHIARLQLSTMAHNALLRGGYTYIGDITNVTKEYLSRTRNLGPKSLIEIEMALHKLNLDFQEEPKC